MSEPAPYIMIAGSVTATGSLIAAGISAAAARLLDVTIPQGSSTQRQIAALRRTVFLTALGHLVVWSVITMACIMVTVIGAWARMHMQAQATWFVALTDTTFALTGFSLLMVLIWLWYTVPRRIRAQQL